MVGKADVGPKRFWENPMGNLREAALVHVVLNRE